MAVPHSHRPPQVPRDSAWPGAGQASPVLAEVVRSGRTESAHRGSVLLLDASGAVLLRAGTTQEPMFPRSVNKPLQATGMVGSGLELTGPLLALAAASHAGEDYHLAGVREILARAGLAETDLQCPPDLPLDERASAALLRAGGSADRVYMNCSGQHAAMLALCVAAGWPTASYTDPGHPLQQRIKLTVERLAGEPVTAIGVDGCGTPLLAISLIGLARAFRAMVLAAAGSAERRVADAMRAHPTWTSGTNRPEAVMMGAVPGLLVKSGAEGVCAFALPDGRAGAVKIDDGTQRAVPPVVATLLRQLSDADHGPRHGEAPGAEADLAALDRLSRPPVKGGGEQVGEIRCVLALPGR